MDWADALDLVVARTGVGRYRVLCADSWPDHAAYRALVVSLAMAPPPPPPPPPDPIALDAERCPHRGIPECGCSGMECGPKGRRPGDRVTIADCCACLRISTASPSVT